MTRYIHDLERGFFAGFQYTGKGKPALTWSPEIAKAIPFSHDDAHLAGALKRVRQQVKTAQLIDA